MLSDLARDIMEVCLCSLAGLTIVGCASFFVAYIRECRRER